MANRRFEMFEYRQVIHRMRQGQSDRAIAKAKVMGRTKCAFVRWVITGQATFMNPTENEIAAAQARLDKKRQRDRKYETKRRKAA